MNNETIAEDTTMSTTTNTITADDLNIIASGVKKEKAATSGSDMNIVLSLLIMVASIAFGPLIASMAFDLDVMHLGIDLAPLDKYLVFACMVLIAIGRMDDMPSGPVAIGMFVMTIYTILSVPFMMGGAVLLGLTSIAAAAKGFEDAAFLIMPAVVIIFLFWFLKAGSKA